MSLLYHKTKQSLHVNIKNQTKTTVVKAYITHLRYNYRVLQASRQSQWLPTQVGHCLAHRQRREFLTARRALRSQPPDEETERGPSSDPTKQSRHLLDICIISLLVPRQTRTQNMSKVSIFTDGARIA